MDVLLHIYVCTYVQVPVEARKKVLEPLELPKLLDLQGVLSHLMWVLETEI